MEPFEKLSSIVNNRNNFFLYKTKTTTTRARSLIIADRIVKTGLLVLPLPPFEKLRR